MTKRQDALDYHATGRPGKIAVVPTKPLNNQRDLSLAYSPGVAEPCLEIKRRSRRRLQVHGARATSSPSSPTAPPSSDSATSARSPASRSWRARAISSSSSPTSTCSISRSAPRTPTTSSSSASCSSRPSAASTSRTSARPTASTSRRRSGRRSRSRSSTTTSTARRSSPAPRCSTRSRSSARTSTRCKVVFSGAGAAAISTAEHYVRLGVKRENILMCDRAGVIYKGRDGRHGSVQGALRDRDDGAHASPTRSSAPTSSSASRSPARSRARWSRRWPTDPIIFALANPDPEILPDEVRAVRADAIIATGRSDYPNQVNNVLGFPFIFRGALDVRATEINEEMKMAATRALARSQRRTCRTASPRSTAAHREVRAGLPHSLPLRSARAALGRAGGRVGRGRERRREGVHRPRGLSRAARGTPRPRARHHARDHQPRGPRSRSASCSPKARSRRSFAPRAVIVDEGIADADPARQSRDDRANRARGIDIPLDDIEIEDPATSPQRERVRRTICGSAASAKGMSLGEARRRLYNGNYFGS